MVTPLHVSLLRSGSVCFSPNGKWCAVSRNRAVEILEVRTGACHDILWPERCAFHFAFSPDSAMLVARFPFSETLGIARWDGSTFVPTEEWEGEDESSDPDFSPCGNYLVLSSRQGFAVVDAQTGEKEFVYEGEGMAGPLATTPTRDVWLTAETPTPVGEIPATFRRWRWPFAETTCEVLPYRVPDFCCMALSADAELLAVLFGDPENSNETLQVYSLSRQMILHAQPATTAPTFFLRWSPRAPRLAFPTQVGIAVGLLDFDTRTVAAEIVVGRRKGDSVGDWPSKVDFSPDGALLAIGAPKGRIVKLRAGKTDVRKTKRS